MDRGVRGWREEIPISRHRREAVHVAIAGICAILYITWTWLFWPFVADDAYIVGRYALNGADGLGLVYNEGERVSALTSPLHALIELMLALVFSDPVAVYRWLAVLVPLAAWAASARSASVTIAQFATYSVLFLASPFLALWSVGGLETPLLAGVIALFTARFVVVARRGAVEDREYSQLGLLAALAFLLRHDSVLFVLPPLLVLAWCDRRRGAMWRGAILCAAISLSWLVFASLFYGDIFPTSAYLKFGLPAEGDSSGLFILLNFLLLSGVIVCLPFLRPQRPIGLGRLLAASFTLSGLLLVVYAARVSGQHMMFGYRLFVPYLPAFALAIALMVKGRSMGVGALVLAVQVAAGWQVQQRGMNVMVVTSLPGHAAFTPEMQETTPAEYGVFIRTLRQDAEDLRSHWAAQGWPRKPRVFLYTGGTGYWLRDFYVFETLVSYRLNCGARHNALRFLASDYAQDISTVRFNEGIQKLVRGRRDYDPARPQLSPTELSYEGGARIAYTFGDDPVAAWMPSTLHAPCDPTVASDDSE